MDYQRWLTLMASLTWATNEKTYRALCRAYNEPHRAYHTQAHIEALLHHLDQVKEYAEDAIALEIAIWFHDAIYNIFSSKNEARSAQWAKNFLEQNQAEQTFIDKVVTLILVTAHSSVPISIDEQLMVDIDLTILGSSPPVFNQYQQQIRREYRLIPRFIYQKKRNALLLNFSQKRNIYQTHYFQQKLESQARDNLLGAVTNL